MEDDLTWYHIRKPEVPGGKSVRLLATPEDYAALEALCVRTGMKKKHLLRWLIKREERFQDQEKKLSLMKDYCDILERKLAAKGLL